MPTCKNCGGSNKKVILDYTPKSYTICPDPGNCDESYKCSEIINAACIQYTGANILLCNTEFHIINQFDDLDTILTAVVNLVCETPPRCTLNITIIPNQDESFFPSLTTLVANGVAPYTYKWEIAQGDFVGHSIFGSTTSSNLNLNCIGSNSIVTGDIDQNIKISNIQLTVTDSNGCQETVHFVYSSDCYPTIVDSPETRQEFLGGRLFNNNGYDTPFALTPMDFMDNTLYMPTCSEMKNICCIEGYEGYEEASTQYRINRDQYFRDLNENVLNESVGSPLPNNILDYTSWEPGGLGDKLIFYKGGLMNYNTLWGCPECTYRYWNEVPWLELGNQTLADVFPMLDPEDCTKFYWLEAVPFGNTPPTGQPGQMVKWATDPLDPTVYNEYAWDPTTNSWNTVLASVLGDLGATDRSRRSAWLKALVELNLANAPFVFANDYGLLHRFKYDLKYPV